MPEDVKEKKVLWKNRMLCKCGMPHQYFKAEWITCLLQKRIYVVEDLRI